MDNTVNAKVEQIRSFFKKAQPDNHPIVNHPLSQCEEYVKGLYFDMLCVMAQYENEDVENQNRFIQRIMAGCNETMTISEHIKRAMEISVDKVTEFVKQCNDNNLKEIFFIDSLIICCANGTPNRKQVDFLAEIADVLCFDKNKVKFISELTVAILEQDSDKYGQLMNNNADEYKKFIRQIFCYTKLFVYNDVLVRNNNEIYYYSPKINNQSLFDEAANFKEIDEITFENQFIDNNINFLSVKKVTLINCKIQNATLQFESVDKILIEDCEFEWNGEHNYTYEDDRSNHYYCDRAINFSLSGAEVSVKNSRFSNFKVFSHYSTDYKGKGVGAVFCDLHNGVIDNKLIIDNCEFRDINTSAGYYRDDGYCCIFYSYDDKYYIEVSNSHFSNCKSDNLNRGMFSQLNRESGNILINSSKLSY